MISTEIREVHSEEDRMQMFRLRYDMYCKKLRWIDPASCPDQLESDAYDQISTHIGAFEDGRLVGTIRLIHPGRLTLPIETSFPKPTLEDLEVTATERVSFGEVSRLIVNPRHASPRHVICLSVIYGLFRYSLSHGITHWLQVVDTTSHRLIQALGFNLRQFAPAQTFLGSESIPSTLKLIRCLAEWQTHKPAMFTLFSTDVASNEVATEAQKVLEAKPP